MQTSFKRVPALDKTFAILELLATSKKPLGISEINRTLNFNKSTVFNIVHTLADLEILQSKSENKFEFGTKLYVLGRIARIRSEIISTVRPYLEMISQRTKLSAFLGTRSGLRTIILDKVDAAFNIRLSSEIGMRLPLLAGAGGKSLLSQLSDAELDQILSHNGLKKFTRFSCVDKNKYKKMIKKVRTDGVAIDNEEYIEGIRALAVPVRINRGKPEYAIWAVGLKRQIPNELIAAYSELLKDAGKEIEVRLSNE